MQAEVISSLRAVSFILDVSAAAQPVSFRPTTVLARNAATNGFGSTSS